MNSGFTKEQETMADAARELAEEESPDRAEEHDRGETLAETLTERRPTGCVGL